MERGKVQVTASDLYLLAKLLNKPIEYFFGQKFSGKDIEDITALIRNSDPEVIELQMPIIKSLLNLQMNVSNLQSLDGENLKNDELITVAKTTYNNLILYLLSVRQLYELGQDAKLKLEEILKISDEFVQ